jgi:hypothetical protein
MYRSTFTGIASLVALWMTITAAGAQQNWQVHTNARYGFSLAYPASLFALEKTSENGAGHVFNAPSQDARLLVGVIVNEDGYTPASYFKFIASTSYAGRAVTYRKLGPTWFAISGEKDGKVFYEKVQFSCNSRLISSFAVIYPAANQRVINPVIERMENSFRSARRCGATKTSTRGASRAPG